MINFVVFDLATGEIESNCDVCGIYGVSEHSSFASHLIPDTHGKYILNEDELKVIHEFDHAKNKHKHRVDWRNRKLERRD